MTEEQEERCRPDGIVEISAGSLCVVGISLRDHFAGQALAGIASQWQGYIYGNDTDSSPIFEETIEACTAIAQDSYALADAMLKARDAKPDDPQNPHKQTPQNEHSRPEQGQG